MAKRQTRVLFARCAFFAYLLLPVIGYAQSTFGDIRGTVRDPREPGGASSGGDSSQSGRQHQPRRRLSDDSGGYPVRKPQARTLHGVRRQTGIFHLFHGHAGTDRSSKRASGRGAVDRRKCSRRSTWRLRRSRSIPRTPRSATPGARINWSRCRSISGPRPPVRSLRWRFLRASSRIVRATYKSEAPPIP